MNYMGIQRPGQERLRPHREILFFIALHVPQYAHQRPGTGRQRCFARRGFENCPKPDRPVDIVIYDAKEKEVLAIGLARYDSDRGGAQEDDRTGGYHNCADEILNYAKKRHFRTKVIFINDGPGLLLGSMWNDYAHLERSRPGKILVATLRMIPERITREWLLS